MAFHGIQNVLFEIRKRVLESIVKVFAIYYAIADNHNDDNDDDDDDVGNIKDDNVIGFYSLSLANTGWNKSKT